MEVHSNAGISLNPANDSVKKIKGNPKTGTSYLLFAFFILFLLSFSSCAFDDDTRFVPKTLASFFLVRDSGTNEYSLLKLENQTLTNDWNNNCGVSSQGLSCVQINSRGLWLSDIQNKKILLTHPGDGSINKEWNFNSFYPHFFIPGNKYILVSDSITPKSIFSWAKKDKHHETDFAAGPPGECVYNAGKFYLLKGCCSVSVISEDAGAEIFTYTTPDTLTNLQITAFYYTYIFGRNGATNVFYGIDPNTNLIYKGTDPTHRQIELTPWFRTAYGREFLNDISLTDSTLSILGFPHPVDAFSCDFFSSMLFYQWQDSLFSYDLIAKTDGNAWPLNGKKLVKGFHWLGADQ